MRNMGLIALASSSLAVDDVVNHTLYRTCSHAARTGHPTKRLSQSHTAKDRQVERRAWTARLIYLWMEGKNRIDWPFGTHSATGQCRRHDRYNASHSKTASIVTTRSNNEKIKIYIPIVS